MAIQLGATINQEISSQVAVSVPVAIAPTGSVAANGALTLGTALLATYSGGLYLWLPAGAAFAGSAAGFYFAVMSSTTLGTIYNITLGAGSPVIPAASSLVSNVIVAAGPGAYTGATTAQTFSIPLNSNILGAQGFARITEMFQTNNSAGVKTFSVAIGGQTVFSSTATTSNGTTAQQLLASQGSQLVNVLTANAAQPLGVATNVQATIGFTGSGSNTPPSLVVSLTLAAATDWVMLSALFAEFFYNA